MHLSNINDISSNNECLKPLETTFKLQSLFFLFYVQLQLENEIIHGEFMYVVAIMGEKKKKTKNRGATMSHD